MCGKLQWGRLSSSLQPGGFSFLATSRQLWKGCGVLTVHAGVAPVRVGAQQSPLGRPVSLWRPSPRCDKVIKETWCPAGGCVPMRNRKPSGCLPACLPACGGFTAPAGAGVQAPSRFSPGILAATSGIGGEIQAEANPPTLTKRKKKKQQASR